MATRTQLQLEPLSGCIHEKMLQSEYEQQRRRIHTLCRWMLHDANEALRMEMRIFIDAWSATAGEERAGEDRPGFPVIDDDRLAAAFALHFRGLFAGDSRASAGAEAKKTVASTGLREAVRQLPAQQRLLYLLHELEGYPPAVLGEWLDLDAAYCSQLIHQARLRLRDAVAA
ncbi:MAG: sigma factor-like helix-turn-helix DNA-binding protein [Terriglobales bacterium]